MQAEQDERRRLEGMLRTMRKDMGVPSTMASPAVSSIENENTA